MTTTIGTLSEFVLQKEKTAAYLECVELFFCSQWNRRRKASSSPSHCYRGRNVRTTVQPTSSSEAGASRLKFKVKFKFKVKLKFKDFYRTEGSPPATFRPQATGNS